MFTIWQSARTFFPETKKVFLLLSMLMAFSTYAQVPLNDECSGAITLTVNANESCANSYTGAIGLPTQSAPSCYGSSHPAKDIWFRFVALAATQTISVTPVTTTDYAFQLYSGECGNLTPIACVNETETSELEALTLTNLIPGNTYFIRLYITFGDAGVDRRFTICINSSKSPITNDECTGAITIPTDESTIDKKYTNVGATLSMPGCVSTANNDIWFKFTATSQRHQVKAYTADYIPLVIQIFEGNCDHLSSIMCFNYPNGIADLTTLTIGKTYYYRLYLPNNNSMRTSIRTYVTNPAIPANDECSGALTLSVNSNNSCSNSYTGALGYATESMPPCSNTGYEAKDAWFKFTATNNTHTITLTAVSFDDYILQAFSGTCGNLTSIACVNNTGLAETEAVTLKDLIPGNTYYLRIYNRYGDATINRTFTICINASASTIPNDECSGAIDIPTDESTINTEFTNVGATLSMPGCATTADNDIWFKFKATSARHQVKAYTTDYVPLVIQVFKGNCNNLTSIMCFNYPNGIADLTTLTIGETYYYRLYVRDGKPLRTNIRTYITAPPLIPNDECANAITLPVNTNGTCGLLYKGALGYATESFAPCTYTGYEAKDAWFKFTAAAKTQTLTLEAVTYDDYVFQVFSGSCNNLSSLACVNNSGLGEKETTTLQNLIPGNSYYVRIYNRHGDATVNRHFTFCITGLKDAVPPPAAPILSGSSLQCIADTIRVNIAGIASGNNVEAYYNNTRINFDENTGTLWYYPGKEGTYTIKAIQKNNTGLVSDTAFTTVTISPIKTVSVNINTPANTLCANSQVTITASAANAGSSPVYQWFRNGTITQSGDNATLVVHSPANNDVISVLLTSNESCVARTTVSSNEINLIVNPITKPEGRISLSEKACVEDEFTATVALSSLTTPLSSWVTLYQLDNPDKATPLGTLLFEGKPLTWKVSATRPFIAKKYFARITPPSSMPCSTVADTDTAQSKQEQMPASVITAQGIYLNSNYQEATTNYQWQIHNGNSWQDITGSSNQQYIPEKAGTYRLLAIRGTCTSTSNEIRITKDPEIAIYPNPATDNLNIGPLKKETKWLYLSIANSAGKTVVARYNIQNQEKVVIPVRTLASGLYYILLENAEGVKNTYRFIKQ